MGLTRDLCTIIHKTRYEDLGGDCIHRVKQAIKDGLAVALAGHQEEPVAIIVDHARTLGGKPQASMWGYGTKMSVTQTQSAAHDAPTYNGFPSARE